jgi:prepilin-type N-terminal cleavage/methylation domain-containing protein
MLPYNSTRGFSLLEMTIALIIVAILSALAVPQFRAQIDRIRVHAALDHVVAELYRTRMLAVESGGPAQLVLQADASGCVRRLRVVALPAGVARTSNAGITLPGLCLRHSGDSIIRYNSRGILRPPARSLRVVYGSFADSVLLSIAGRIRRSY